jgi:hypothetical protein
MYEPCTLQRNQFNKISKHLPIYGTDKKASCVQKSAIVLDDKRGGTSCKETTCIFFIGFFFFFSNVSCTNLVQLLCNSNNFF